MGLVLGVVATITLVPFAFRWPDEVRVLVWSATPWRTAFDVVANVALFLPLGFLYALTRAADERPARPRVVLLQALLLGALASALVETVQLFEPERYPSPVDVVTNALGALLGAWAHRRLAARLTADSGVVGRLALELPVMGLVYLLVPLCTLAALTLGAAATPDAPAVARSLGLVSLALFGGTLLGQVQRWHLGPNGVATPARVGGAAALWLAVGAVPALATGAMTFAVAVAAAGTAAWAYGRSALRPEQANRRFEVTALSRAAPYLGAYLALLAIGDPPALPEAELSKLDVLRRVETLMGFVVVGYVLSEGWGRLELRYRYSAGRVALAAVVGSVVAEALRLGDVPSLEIVPTVLARVVAAAYGGWLYHLQRTHVRALVAARSSFARGTAAVPASPPAALPAPAPTPAAPAPPAPLPAATCETQYDRPTCGQWSAERTPARKSGKTRPKRRNRRRQRLAA